MALRLGGLGLIALVILGLGFLVGRASAPKAATSPSAGSATASAAPGASRVENGVPVGYQRTQVGAVAAATNYTQALSGALLLEPDQYRAAVGTVAAPESKSKLLQDAETSLAAEQNNLQLVTLAHRGVKVAISSYPLAYHVNNYSPTVAELSIWTVSIVGEDGQLAASQAWNTMTVDLEWTNGDWKETSVGSTPGPVPVLGQGPVQTKDLPQQLSSYQLYRYAPTK